VPGVERGGNSSKGGAQDAGDRRALVERANGARAELAAAALVGAAGNARLVRKLYIRVALHGQLDAAAARVDAARSTLYSSIKLAVLAVLASYIYIYDRCIGTFARSCKTLRHMRAIEN
jgi:hypothetical protein